MYPARVDYTRAATVEEATAILASADGDDVRPLAGGQGLVPDMKVRETSPDVLVDIGSVDALRSIDPVDGEEAVSIGALTTHAEVAGSDLLASRVPVLPATAREIADRQVRNVATVGGNLAEADPEADLPAAVLALDAALHTEGPEGSRVIPAGEFFLGAGRTALQDDELLTAVRVPTVDAGSYLKKTHPARGYAVVGVATALGFADGVLDDVRVAAVGVEARPLRLPSVERELTGVAVGLLRDDGSVLSAASERARTDLSADRAHGDGYASASYRAAVLPTYVERAVSAALDGGAAA